jgi:hypothetical protein
MERDDGSEGVQWMVYTMVRVRFLPCVAAVDNGVETVVLEELARAVDVEGTLLVRAGESVRAGEGRAEA